MLAETVTVTATATNEGQAGGGWRLVIFVPITALWIPPEEAEPKWPEGRNPTRPIVAALSRHSSGPIGDARTMPQP